jgi:hypothetical protein
MPQNCSNDVQTVIAHFDKVFTSGNQTDIDGLKKRFSMGEVKHLDDAVGACTSFVISRRMSRSDELSVRNNLWQWQSLQVTSGPNAPFYQFCDALEVKDGKSAPQEGWGLEHALSA